MRNIENLECYKCKYNRWHNIIKIDVIYQGVNSCHFKLFFPIISFTYKTHKQLYIVGNRGKQKQTGTTKLKRKKIIITIYLTSIMNKKSK